MTEGLVAFPLLAALTAADRCQLEAALERIELEAGTAIFEEGDEADALWLVASGEVEIASRRAGSRGRCGRGRALGSLGLVLDGPREATARTASRCVLLRLSREAFEALVASAPHSACRLAIGVARESAVALRDALAELERRAAVG